MRFLHTSDWHLGVSVKRVDCGEEQALFLDWLIDILREREIDVLLVAGDIFDKSQPSNAARRLYFNFLRRCAEIKTLKNVVIVAGNHDSPSDLDAPRAFLELHNIHVVGRLERDPQSREGCLVPIEGPDGEVEAVVAAVPYMPEARLGVSLGDGRERDLRAAYRDAFEQLYSDLADQAHARWPGARLVATGHLTAYGDPEDARPGDFHSNIHRINTPEEAAQAEDIALVKDGGEQLDTIGTIAAMDPGIFDPRYHYIALGHIHRPMPVGGLRHIRYCGSPVASTLPEAAIARQVLQVEIRPETAPEDSSIEPITVPCWRDIFEIRGAPDEVLERLRTLSSDAPLAPILMVCVELGEEDVAGQARFEDFQKILAENHPPDRRPLIVEVREVRARRPDAAPGALAQLGAPETWSNFEVFKALYQRRFPESSGPSSSLVERFREIEQSLYDQDERE